MNRLTVKQYIEICKQNKYVLFRTFSGQLIGHNCRIWKLVLKGYVGPSSEQTRYVSYISCDFHTYLMYKVPFL